MTASSKRCIVFSRNDGDVAGLSHPMYEDDATLAQVSATGKKLP
jgi:hypothetical protein